jgi:hypothetical protein
VEYQGSQNTTVIGMYFYYQYYKMWHVWDSHKVGWIEIHSNAVVRDLFGPLRQSHCKHWNLHSIGSQLLEVFIVETQFADVQFSLVASVLLYANSLWIMVSCTVMLCILGGYPCFGEMYLWPLSPEDRDGICLQNVGKSLKDTV